MSPSTLALEGFVAQHPDRQALAKIFSELEFHSLMARVDRLDGNAVAPLAGEPGSAGTAPEVTAIAAPAPPPLPVTIVADPSELAALAAHLRTAPLLAFDTETSSLHPHDAELIGLSLAASPTEVWYLPFGHREPSTNLFEAPQGTAPPHPAVRNLPPIRDPVRCLRAGSRPFSRIHPSRKPDTTSSTISRVLRRAGVETAGVAYDSMLASFVLDPSRRSHGIDALALEFLGQSMSQYTDLTGKGKAEIPFAEVPVDKAAAYCGADSATVLSLHAHFAPDLERHALLPLLQRIELPLIPVLVDMEWAGIAIDGVRFAELGRALAHDLQVLEQEVQRAAGGKPLNVNSPKQLAAILFGEQGLPVLKKTKTGPSTDAEVLEQLAEMGHELPRLILNYRELQKLKSTYVDVLPLEVNRQTGRIHTSFNQVGAQTGRLASSDPNLQNIPVRSPRGEAMRRAFIPAPGWKFVVADYSQIELRLMAHLSGDPAFIEAFRQGDDIHRQTAAIIFGVTLAEVTGEMRGRAKTINFGTIYGQGPFALSKMLGITQEEAKRFIGDYFLRFAGVRVFLDRQVEIAREKGYVETLFGRRRYIAEINDRNFNIRAFGERTAQNTPLQGSAADLIKMAMVRIHHALPAAGLQARLLLQVHDELVVEAPAAEAAEAARVVREHMENAATLDVPLLVSVGIGDNWVDAKH